MNRSLTENFIEEMLYLETFLRL